MISRLNRVVQRKRKKKSPKTLNNTAATTAKPPTETYAKRQALRSEEKDRDPQTLSSKASTRWKRIWTLIAIKGHIMRKKQVVQSSQSGSSASFL